MRPHYLSTIAFAFLTGALLAQQPSNQNRRTERNAVSRATETSERVVRQSDRPNIVFIYADDLGYGDLSCYDGKGIPTPNLDALAKKGVRFTDFYSASPVCSPSRAALLTGRYPVRQGINGVFFPESYTGIDSAEVTLAETLKGAGYRTGMVGKWHLGHLESFRPLKHGFDSYFGIPYSNDMNSVVYLRDNAVEEFKVDQRYITQRYTQEALKFIDKNKVGPFFLYLAHNMPHIPIYASPEFVGKSGRGLYGDVIQELDWSVGEVMKKLRENGLEENTLVVFSSDNGPWLVMGDDAGSAGPLREGKQTTFEGGMRVPAIACWKGKIPAGRVETRLATMMDWFPTLTKLGEGKLPTDRPIDGEDLWPILTGTGTRQGQQMAYYFNGKLEAFRLGDWKLKQPHPGYGGTAGMKALAAQPLLLFNLRQDLGEQTNLADQNEPKVQEVQAAMRAFEHSLGKVPPGKVQQAVADKSLSKNRNP
ncbi:MAG: sulfatase [Sphingobacteriaceae bacterium]|nr:sulfatase [Cytophagaceae bacterium]